MAENRYTRVLATYRETSREALESVWASLPAVDADILRAIETSGGATSDEIEQRTGMKHQTVSAQVSHMASAGLLVDSGERRANGNGRKCIVWALASKVAPGTPGYLASLPAVASITGRAVRPLPDSTPAATGLLF